MPFIFRWLVLLLCGVVVLTSARAQELQRIAPHTQCILSLQANHGDTVLAVEGRFLFRVEYRPLAAIRLVLNGTLLDGQRIIGPHEMYAPEIDTFRFTPRPRYAALDRCFAFPQDNDYLEANGPWMERINHRIVGCPALLQLRVGDLLKAGANELIITNGEQFDFELRRYACTATAIEQEEPLITQLGWASPAQSAEVRQRYRTALQDGKLAPEARAQIFAALGTAELLREGGKREDAARDWQQALAASDHFDLRGEAAYRLAAERLRTGRWPDARTEALVRKAATEAESWAGLAQALLDVIDGQQASNARLLIRPADIDAPITLDGVLDEAAWQSATSYPINVPMGRERGAYCDTQARFVVVPDGLAVGFTGVIPASTNWTRGLARDENVWEDNSVELFLAPDSDMRHYYEINATPLGGQFDARNRWFRSTDATWNGDWRMASRLDGTQFGIEYLIPWSDLGMKSRPARGAVFITAIARYVVEMQATRRVGWFYTLTQHRGYDSHRLMDGAVIVMP